MRSAVVIAALAGVLASGVRAGDVVVHRAAGRIVVDGALDEPAWRDAYTSDEFFETFPGDNTPPRVATRVFATYDAQALYVAAKCSDPDPRAIRAPLSDRDALEDTADAFIIFLNTRNSRSNVLLLRVSPRNAQADSLFNDVTSVDDPAPDFDFQSAARIVADGWQVEIRIPFRSLRYSRDAVQRWGVLFQRLYPRETQHIFSSAPLPRESNCLMCREQAIAGLDDLPGSGGFVAVPYARAAEKELEGGLDVKWNPNASTTIDATLNPDFSQVESDVPQVSANRRFSLFFPEKRSFFLEGKDLFAMPINAVHTRSITAPRFGIRDTAKIGALTYAVLFADDRGGGSIIAPGPLSSELVPAGESRFAIARARLERGDSFAGALVVDRSGSRVFGPDLQWRPTENDVVTSQLLGSSGHGESGAAFIANWQHAAARAEWLLDVQSFGDGFRADAGFVPQVGYREVSGNIGPRFWRDERTFYFLRPYIAADVQQTTDGETILETIYPGLFVYGTRNLTGEVTLRPRERVRAGEALIDQAFATASVQLDPGRRITRVKVEVTYGDAVDFDAARKGRGGAVTLAIQAQPNDHLELRFDGAREWIDGGFTAVVARTRATYSFTPRSRLRAILERGDESHSASLLYSYRVNWQTALFAGFGDDGGTRSFFVKIAYAVGVP